VPAPSPRPFLDLLFPRDCVLTGEPLGDSRLRYVSDAAAARLPVIRDPRCPKCGHPYFGPVEESPACPHCADLRPAFREGRCGYLLSRDCRTLVHALKYQRKRHLARDLAALLAAAPGFLDFLAGAVVVPVPLHPRKQRKRGFNQAEEILGELAARAGEAFETRRLLRRVSRTESQTRATRKERMKRVKGAFEVIDGGEPLPAGRRYVLFDDVFTTGATLDTCARALRQAGPRRIDVAAFAHG
jgi:ComF family protein